MIEKYSETFKVRVYEIDPKGRVSLSFFSDIFQEIAANHASKLGCGRRKMLENGMVWVLTRLYVTIARYPRQDELFHVTTWPSGLEKSFAYRDFTVFSNDGDEIARATSSWLLMSVEERKMIRAPEWLHQVFKDIPDRELEFQTRIVPKNKESEFEELIVARRCDLDVNDHVNNVRLVEWLQEAVPDDIFSDKRPISMDVAFRQEGRRNDRVMSCCTKMVDSRVFSHALIRKDDNVELVRAVTSWE